MDTKKDHVGLLDQFLKPADSDFSNVENSSKDPMSLESNLDELMFDLPERYDSELLNTSFYFSTNEKAINRLENNAKLFDQPRVNKNNEKAESGVTPRVDTSMVIEKALPINEDKQKSVANPKTVSFNVQPKENNTRTSITSLYIDTTKSIEPELQVQPIVITADDKEFEELHELSDINSVLDFSFDVKTKNGKRLSDIVKEERANMNMKTGQNNTERSIDEVSMVIFDTAEFSKRRSLTKDNTSKRGRRLSEKLKSIVEKQSDFDTIVNEREKTHYIQPDSINDNKRSQITKVISNISNNDKTDIIFNDKFDSNSQDDLLISSSPLTKTFCETSMFNDDIIYSSPSKTLMSKDQTIEQIIMMPKDDIDTEKKQVLDNIEIQERQEMPFVPLELEKEAKKVNNKASNLSKVQKALLLEPNNESDFFNNRKNEINKKIVEENVEPYKSPPRSPIKSNTIDIDKSRLRDSMKKADGVDPQLRDMILLSSSKKPAKKTHPFTSFVKTREYQELMSKTILGPEKPLETSKPVDKLASMHDRIERLHIELINTLESRKEDVEFLQKVTEGFNFDKKTRENELKRLVQLKINHSLLLSSKVALNKDLQAVLADKTSHMTLDAPHKPKKTTNRHFLERLFNLTIIRIESTPKNVEYTLRYRHSFVIFAKCRGNTKKLEFLQIYFLEGQKRDDERKTRLSETFVRLYEKRISQTQCKDLYDALGYICKLHDTFMEVFDVSDHLLSTKAIDSYSTDKECIFMYTVKPHRLPLIALTFRLVANDANNWQLSYTVEEENKKLSSIFDKSFREVFHDLNRYIEGIFGKERMSVGLKLAMVIKKVNGLSLARFKFPIKRDVVGDNSGNKLSAQKTNE